MMNNCDKNYNKFQSRKWRLILLVIALTFIGAFAPPMLSLWVFGASEALVIISGTELVSLLTLIISAYFGANVWQKHIDGKASFEANVSLGASATVESAEDKKA